MRKFQKLLKSNTKERFSLLIEHKDKLTELAKVLLDKEVIFKDNLQKIFGDRPFDKFKSEAIIAEKNVDEKESSAVEQEDTVK